ncbi:hypothetical protein ACQ4PT_061119 [Festuca glaucescens]
MTTTANNGDPLEDPGFVREEEEEAVGEERYDSDSDDDDVDRYVFLARQPAPAEASDDDDGEMPGEGGGGGGGGGGCERKRSLQQIVSDAPPAAKKARLGLAAPRGASAEESGSEEPVRSAERFQGDLDQEKKNKKRRRCGGEPQVQRAVRGERSNGADSEASQGSQHRDVTAGRKTSVAAAEALAGAPRRFVCSLCGKCFGSYQALGGHVHLGHKKKARNAIAGDVTGNSCHDEKLAMADGPGHGKEKALVAAAFLQDVDSSSGDSNSNEEMFIDAANHGDHRGNGNIKGEKVTVATSHDDADGTGRKFAVGGCHDLAACAIVNANSSVRQYMCEVCGKECLSGQALGGHMRKHQKRSPHNGGKERKSPEFAHGAGHGQEKIAVAASPGESHRDGKKIISATACHQDVDSSSGDSKSNGEMIIDAANHRGDGNVEAVATRHHDADGNGNGTERKVAGIGNVSSIVRKRQYKCEVCGKECLSGQALGGHMRKHQKRSPHNGGKERRSVVAIGAAHGQGEIAVAASPAESEGDGKKIISAADYHRDVDSSSGDSNSNSNEEMFVAAAKHCDADGHGNGTERKAVVRRCHEVATGAIGNANGVVRKTLQYRCEICGKEYLSGQALGGHMRKHRKLSPHDGGNERRSPEVNGMPNERTAVIAGNRQLSKTTNSQYGTPFDRSLIGWL